MRYSVILDVSLLQHIFLTRQPHKIVRLVFGWQRYKKSHTLFYWNEINFVGGLNVSCHILSQSFNTIRIIDYHQCPSLWWEWAGSLRVCEFSIQVAVWWETENYFGSSVIMSFFRGTKIGNLSWRALSFIELLFHYLCYVVLQYWPLLMWRHSILILLWHHSNHNFSFIFDTLNLWLPTVIQLCPAVDTG